MATDIILRSVKAAALTHAEMDQNWESLAGTVDIHTASATIAVTDQNKIIEADIASGTMTLPTVANAAGTDTDSFRVTVKNINATSLSVAGNGAELIEGSASVALLQYEVAEFTLDGAGTGWTIASFYGPNIVGLTATPTELNYVDGVTSSIQTQLDAKQPLDADLTAIAALANTDSNFIVGNGSAWVAESGATARTSLGVDAAGTDNSTDVTIAAGLNYITIAGQVITLGSVDLTTDVTGALPAANIGTNAIETAKLNALAVTEAKIAALAVTEAKIGALAVTVGKIGAAAVTRSKISTATVSLSGTIASQTYLSIVFANAYAFFPMIHMAGVVTASVATKYRLKVAQLCPNQTDSASADSPSFSLFNGDTVSDTYDVDYRYIQA